MIWVFDSGMWGRITLWYLQDTLPQYSFLYLWDTTYLPYGNKSPEFLRPRTFECLQWMFDQWCVMVILACNTASAYAIRAWQEMYPERKVLSVTIPGVEEVIEWGYTCPMLLGTAATVASDIYPHVTSRMYPDISISRQSLSPRGWVEAIESWSWLQDVVDEFFSTISLDEIDCIVLWCTHYPVLAPYIYSCIGYDIPLLNPGLYSAQKLQSYIYRHPDIAMKLSSIDDRHVMHYVTWTASHSMIHVDIPRRS